MYKAIKGYEGFYETNELGQVRSIDRVVECKDGSVRKYKSRELKPGMDKHGYTLVRLTKNGVAKTCTVHRLVAEAFIPNPKKLPEVHHKNHDRTDNRAKNLQWVTKAEQMDEHLRAALGTKLRVVGHGIDKTYNSAMAVQRELGISQPYVSMVANGIHKQAKGYRIFFRRSRNRN